MHVSPALAPHHALSIQLLRALRGRRSQSALSKRLGYRSNIAQRWESGHSLPTAATFLACCVRLRIDVAGGLTRYYGRRPEWLARHAPDTPQAVAAFLGDLRGKVPIRDLAARVGVNRYTVARWLTGRAQPRLHELLALVDVGSGRLLDFVALFIEPSRVPSLAAPWARLQRSREAAYATPWSHAVLRALELGDGPRGEAATLRWLGSCLGAPAPELRAALRALLQAGQIERRRGRYVVTGAGDVDTGGDPLRARALKAHWTRAALQRLEAGAPGLFGYAVFAVSRRDLRRLREVQLEYVKQVHAITAESQPSECVGLFCTQLLDLSLGEGNALAGPADATSGA